MHIHVSKSEVITEQHLIDACVLRVGPPRTFVALDHYHMKMSNDMINDLTDRTLRVLNSKQFRNDPSSYVSRMSTMAIVVKGGIMKMIHEILEHIILREFMQFGDTIVYPRDIEHSGVTTCDDEDDHKSCLLDITRGSDISSYDRKVQQSARKQFRTWTSKINAPFAL